MLEIYLHTTILLVSAIESAATQITQLLEEEGFSGILWVNSIDEAKRILIDTDVDLILIDTPLPGEDGAQFAIDLTKNKSLDFSIIMLIQADYFEQNLYKAERMGIITLKHPMDPHLLLQTLRLLISFQAKIKRLESKADKLQQKLEDDRIVSRAKLCLIEHLKMKEEDAHHYIEKAAMDRCVKKTKIASDIIRKFDKT